MGSSPCVEIASLARDISPPPPKRRRTGAGQESSPKPPPTSVSSSPNDPSPAAVEAGRARVSDHLNFFLNTFSRSLRNTPSSVPRLSLPAFAHLYSSNQHPHGHHFVIHQHNHPQAGVHYDVRLQFSATSSLSFAVPKGLPGDPNSRSPGRMAIETRVHCLWNHLIESASWKSGSLLVWDTGTYSVLPRKIADKNKREVVTDEGEDTDESEAMGTTRDRGNASGKKDPENEKLIEAFKGRYIRLRLHGVRLPKGYTITLRLPSNNDVGNGHRIARKRRRKSAQQRRQPTPATTDSEYEAPPTEITTLRMKDDEDEVENLDTDTEEDEQTRNTNAYPGSHNTINSIHQRKWFIALDKRSSGFKVSAHKPGTWERDGEQGFEPFWVRGREHERSVVTGRLAREVEEDEGVEGYRGRGGWRGIEQ